MILSIVDHAIPFLSTMKLWPSSSSCQLLMDVFLVLATSRPSLVHNHCCCDHLQTAISDVFPASASSRSGSGKTAPDKSGDLSLDRLVRTFPHCHHSSSSLFSFPHVPPFSLNPSFSLFLLSSDSYLPANWALRRQQREDIEEDEYVTVSC